MIKTYRYRLQTNSYQEAEIDSQLEMHRYVYNKMLKQRIKIYKDKSISVTYNMQQRQLPLLKSNRIELLTCNAQALQETTRRLDETFQNFFEKIKNGERTGFPRFKSKKRFNSLRYSTGFKITGNRIYISKIGTIKFHKSRDFKGELKKIIVKRCGNKYYVSLVCEITDKPTKAEVKKMCGIDLGINQYVTTSDGAVIETKDDYTKRRDRLALNQRRLSRKKMGSNNRKKAKLRVATCHEKISNSRNDFLHKASFYLVKTYDLLVFEDLKIVNMTRRAQENGVSQKSGLNRSILNMAWGKFLEYVTYKAEEAGKYVFKVNPQNTSKICSKCHHKNEGSLKKYRIYVCESCGHEMDRDWNSGTNVFDRFVDTVRHTEINACGALTEKLKDMICEYTISPRTSLMYVRV